MNMPAIEFVYYHNLLPAPLQIYNTGHSVSLITPKPENFTQFPFIFGGKLRAEYEYVGLHFHWGDKNNRGSVRMSSVIDRNVKWLYEKLLKVFLKSGLKSSEISAKARRKFQKNLILNNPRYPSGVAYRCHQ